MSIQAVITFLATLASAFLLNGCSPQYDWRDVRVSDSGWIATFPGKPVEVTRSLKPPSFSQPIELTLQSARIDENLFATGWVKGGDEKVRQALELAMLENIGKSIDQAKQKKLVMNGISATETVADGTGVLSQGKEAGSAKPMKLMMRTLVTPAGVLEILAIGPAQTLTDESARQFVESLRQP